MEKHQCITRNGKTWRSPRRLSKADKQRLNKLAIPPAYRKVCASPSPSAKLQATAVDQKGKTHYYYHADFVDAQRKKRFARVGQIDMPQILRRTKATLRTAKKGSRAWQAAAALRLIALTGIRPGSEKYFTQNGSVGAMTLQKRHLKGGGVLEFKGKSKVNQRLRVHDPSLDGALGWLKRHASGRRLFSYPQDAVSLLRNIQGNAEMKLKDLRTYVANDLYRAYVKKLSTKYPGEEPKRIARNALKHTAEQMGHTPSVCRKYYLVA
jgi:DNA topoisomerase I